MSLICKVLCLLFIRCYDYTWTKYNDHCYKAFTSHNYHEHRTFSDSRAFCQTQGGDLAVISDAAEMDAAIAK